MIWYDTSYVISLHTTENSPIGVFSYMYSFNTKCQCFTYKRQQNKEEYWIDPNELNMYPNEYKEKGVDGWENKS